MKAVSEERSFLWRFGGVKVDNHNVVDKGANMAHGHQRCCDMVSTLLVGLGGQVQPLVSCYVCRPVLYSHSAYNVPPPRRTICLSGKS